MFEKKRQCNKLKNLKKLIVDYCCCDCDDDENIFEWMNEKKAMAMLAALDEILVKIADCMSHRPIPKGFAV